MNLYELNEMIQILLDQNDPDNDDLIHFYLRKRDELVLELEVKIKEVLENA